MDHTKQKSKSCPRCNHSELLPAKVESAKMDICARCAGLWCSNAEWLDDVHGSRKTLHALTGHVPAEEVPDEQAVNEDIDDFLVVDKNRLQCPDCNCEMLELSVGNPPFTVIEQCKRCRLELTDQGMVRLPGRPSV